MLVLGTGMSLSHCKDNCFLHSQNTCSIFSVGTSKPELQAIAIEIFEVCVNVVFWTMQGIHS